MTTPTPNERDCQLANQIDWQGTESPSTAEIIASYRQEIEAEKDKRISTLEAALKKAEKAIGNAIDPRSNGGWGNLNRFEKSSLEDLQEALAAIREAMPTSPISPPQGAGVSGDRNGNQP